MEKTEDVKDKICLVCGKPEMLLERYSTHAMLVHNLSLEEDQDINDWMTARRGWEQELANNAEEQDDEKKTLACDYDSELGKRYSEIDSENEDIVEEKTTPYKHKFYLQSSVRQKFYLRKFFR